MKTSKNFNNCKTIPKTTKNSRELQNKHKTTIARLKWDPKPFKKA